MTFGLEIRNASGDLMFDSSSVVGKYITTIAVSAGGSGSYASDTYANIYGICIITGYSAGLLDNFGTLVSSSGNTVSWASRVGAKWDAASSTYVTGNISAACNVVIFARV